MMLSDRCADVVSDSVWPDMSSSHSEMDFSRSLQRKIQQITATGKSLDTRRTFTLYTLVQSQCDLYVPTYGLQANVELIITVMFLSSTRIVAAIVQITAFRHGRDPDIELRTREKRKKGLSLCKDRILNNDVELLFPHCCCLFIQ